MDSVNPERRSEIMGRVLHADTRPEIVVRRILHRMGYRFRLHRRDLPGKPDVTLPKWRTVVLIHGCFWHRHEGCPNTRTPKSKIEFWTKKFDDNIRRDRIVREQLAALGWRVLTIWECELRDVSALTDRIKRFIEGPA
jgi:DNA mismatch endonuclease, patch repair protein